MDEIGNVGPGGRGDASRRRVGSVGERRTQEMLLRALRDVNAVVVHSVKIPGAQRADVDHVVITANGLLLIDTKLWKPGIYWTRGGATMRNLKAFSHGDKHTMPMALDRFTAAVPQTIQVAGLFVVHTNTGKARLRFWKPPGGCGAVAGPAAIERFRDLIGTPTTSPDPQLVEWVGSHQYR